MMDLRTYFCLYCKLSIANTCLLPRVKLDFLFHIILHMSTDVWFIFFRRVKPSLDLFWCFFIPRTYKSWKGRWCSSSLTQGYKSSILVLCRVFSTKRHYIYLSKCLLGCTRINNNKTPHSFFRFWARFSPFSWVHVTCAGSFDKQLTGNRDCPVLSAIF